MGGWTGRYCEVEGLMKGVFGGDVEHGDWDTIDIDKDKV